MRNIDLQLLRSFRTTASAGNMTKAAKLLNLTQGAISQQIRKLEEQFDCRLLNRSNKGLSLTREGEKLYHKAYEILSLNDQIMNSMIGGDFSGKLDFGVPLDLVNTVLPSILRDFAVRYPDIDINLVCAPTLELDRLYDEGALDITLREEIMGEENALVLTSDQLVWIAAKNSKALNLDPLPLSIARNECVFRAPTLAALDQYGRAWKSVYESNNIEAVQAMVKMDLAVGVYLQSLVPADLTWTTETINLPKLPQYSVTLAIADGKNKNLAALLAEFVQSGFELKRNS
jgi:DNA-binding transcriptional LysR family regulator